MVMEVQDVVAKIEYVGIYLVSICLQSSAIHDGHGLTYEVVVSTMNILVLILKYKQAQFYNNGNNNDNCAAQ